MEKAQGRKGGRGGGAEAEGVGSPSHNAMPPERALGPGLHALCCRKKAEYFPFRSTESTCVEINGSPIPGEIIILLE